MTSLIHGILKKKKRTNEPIYKTEIELQIENKLLPWAKAGIGEGINWEIGTEIDTHYI